MSRSFAGFDWDEGNAGKCRRHGVSVPEIEGLFAEPVMVLPDPAHSREETRFHAVGRTEGGRMVFLVFTYRKKRGRQFIRPISARYMHDKEIKCYEEKISGS